MSEVLCQQLSIDGIVDDRTLRTWLEQQAKDEIKYLLAHADDGVIWGRFDEGKLTTAETVFPQFPSLRLMTLQQCRVFGASGEVMLWQTDGRLRARLLLEKDAEKLIKEPQIILEHQILWGTQKENESNGFTLVSDGQQGLRHAVPLTGITFNKSKNIHRPLRLSVYHYIDYDDAGVAHVHLSRLVNLTTEQELAHAAETSQEGAERVSSDRTL